MDRDASAAGVAEAIEQLRGGVADRDAVFAAQMRMLEVNDWVGEDAIAFEPFQPMTKNPTAPAG